MYWREISFREGIKLFGRMGLKRSAYKQKRKNALWNIAPIPAGIEVYNSITAKQEGLQEWSRIGIYPKKLLDIRNQRM